MQPDRPTTTRPVARRTGDLGQVVLLAIGLAAAVTTIDRAQGMWTVPGTMGLGPGRYVTMWSLMMAAMMLPSVAPFASRYLRSLTDASTARGAGFVAGYLVIWTGCGVVAYGLAMAVDAAVAQGGTAPRLLASAVLAANAVYQLTPVKQRLLGRCRSPFGLLVTYTGFRGGTRDLRAGLRHGLTCLGCCWSLMALMVVAGTMNVIAMVLVGVVVAVEKLARRGAAIGRGVGVVSAVLAIVVLAVPEVGGAAGGSGGMPS